MGWGEVSERVRAVLRPVATVCTGLAAVLLVWAAGLGWWSRLGAPRASGEETMLQIGGYRAD